MKIRLTTTAYIKENPGIFRHFIDDRDSTIDNYINRMSKDRTYADHLSILATAITINKNIIMHQLYRKPLLIFGSNYIEEQVHLSYHRDILHYESVTCRDDGPASLRFEDVLFV
jgi:hypothetical protein